LRIVLLLGTAVALLFWPLWLLKYRSPIGGGDLWSQLYPVWSYVAEWVRRGVVPLWSTRLMAGDPIIAEAQYGLANPLNWPLFLSHPVPAWLVSVRGVLPLWLAGAGLYLYLRRSPVWRLDRAPAVTGAIVYMASDPFVAHLGHPQFNDTLAWLPWALWGIDAALRRKNRIPGAALALALLWLAGHAQAALYATCLVIVTTAWQVLEGKGRRTVVRRLGRAALVAFGAACLAAPGLLPALERYPYTDRAAIPPKEGEYEFHTGMALDYVSPLYHGRNLRTFWAPWDRVESGSVGIVGLALAALGLVTDQRRRILFLWMVAIVTVLFALGTQGPLYPRLSGLPLFSATWKTGRAIFVLSFVLAIAAGLGAQHLQRARGGPVRTGPVRTGSLYTGALWGGLVLLGAVVVAARAETWSATAPSVGAAARARAGLMLASALLGTTGVLGVLGRSHLVGRAGLAAVALAELTATGALADAEPLPQLSSDPHAAAIAFLQADTGWFRVDVDAAARGLWSPASVMAAGFDVPQGTGNPMEIVVYNQFYWGIPHKGMPAYHALGAKYVIVPKGAQPGAEGIWPVFLEDPLVDIHLNTNALQRVWLVYHTTPVNSLEAAFSAVMAADFEPTVTATVTGGPALDAAGQGRIEVLAYGPNRAAFSVTTSEPALLVLSDLRYPGWRGRIDGKPAPIHATNGISRGMVVPAGTSRVEMRYFPTSLRAGLGLMAWGMLVCAATAWGKSRPRTSVHAAVPALRWGHRSTP